MSTAELQQQILATEQYAAQTHWNRSVPWARVGGFCRYSPSELSPAGLRALEACKAGRSYALDLCDFTHWDAVIFSTLALAA